MLFYYQKQSLVTGPMAPPINMCINIYKPLLIISLRGQMLLTLLEIHLEFSTVPYRVLPVVSAIMMISKNLVILIWTE